MSHALRCECEILYSDKAQGGSQLSAYLVTAFVPSCVACMASSPGSKSFTAVSTSLIETVLFVPGASLHVSLAILSKMSFMKLFIIFIARLLMPHSGWICLRTLYIYRARDTFLFDFLRRLCSTPPTGICFCFIFLMGV